MVVLPGTSYVSLALEAAGGGVNSIRDLEFEQVFVVGEKPRVLTTVLDDGGRFEIVSGPVRHARGTLVAETGDAPPGGLDGTLDDARARCTQRVDGKEFYAALRRNGNEYGPAFQGIQSLWTGGTEAVARIEAPAGPDALLDACIQTLSACRESGGRTYYLKSIGGVRLHREPGTIAWSHADAAGDVFVYDEDGALVAELTGVRFEYLDQAERPVAVTATFTAEPVEESLRFWGEKLGTPYAVEFAPYNQVFQQLLDPGSLVSQNTGGANVVLLRLEDFVRYKNELKPRREIAGDLERHTLPGGLEIAHLLKYETDYVYTEIFVDDAYGKHGIELPDDACIVDIGANIGLFTLRMQQLCKNPTIYSFEPAPKAFRCLEANANAYCGNAHVFNAGVSDADKTAPFTFYKHATVFSSYNADAEQDEAAVRAVVENMLRGHAEYADDFMENRMESETVDVQLRSLSSVIDEQGIDRIDLLKIDVERAELDVLNGIRDEHWPRVQQVVIEVHDQQGDLIRAVTERLKEKGFETVLDEEELLSGSGLFNVYAHRGSVRSREERAADTRTETIARHVDELVAGLKGAAARNPAPFLVAVCPGTGGFLAMEDRLAAGLEGLSNVHFTRARDVTRLYPAAADHDAHGDQLGHVPFTRRAYAALGTFLARRLYRLDHPPAKVIALDCDNTLWKGVVGEDGVEGIVPNTVLQEFMVRQLDAGTILCLVSKNVESDVEAVFSQRKDMVLKEEHVVGTKINWNPKSRNLHELAAELNLGLDSFVFIDDNPVECAEVEANCPGVLVLPLPEDDHASFLDHVWAFDHLKVTAEDKKRTQLYAANMEREQSRAEAPSLKAFIDSLDLRIEIDELSPESLPRASQLTQRTNQFNFTTIRRSESDITSSGLRGLITGVKDRFGDYGLVGLQLFETTPEALTVDTMLLSCRVLGRGVEYRMLARLGEIAVEEGIPEVVVNFEPSAKNLPAKQFLDAVGYRFAAADLAKLTYEPADEQGDAPAPKAKTKSGRPADSTLFAEIATELRDPGTVLEQVIARNTQERSAALGEYVGATSGLERQVAAIWQAVLGIDQIGIHDNFFEIGGSSLKAVQVIAEMTRELGVELRAVALFEKPTIHALAEMLQSGDAAAKQGVEDSRARGARRRTRRRVRRSR